MKKMAVTALLVFCLLLSGCANMNDRGRTISLPTIIGGVAGAIAGSIFAKEKGLAIGAGLGALAGYLAGRAVADRKDQYASREEMLNLEIHRAEEFNKAAVNYNETLRSDISRLEQEVKNLRSAHIHEKTRQDLLKSKKAEIENRLNKYEQLENDFKIELDALIANLNYVRNADSASDLLIVKLEQEIFELEKNLEELREGSRQLAEINERLVI